MSEASDCLFCAIAAGDLTADLVAENPMAVAFRDVSPKAPTHVLVVPRRHLRDVVELAAADPEVAAGMLELAARVVAAENLTGGFRVVLNTGSDAGQSVPHVHAHVLGGRHLSWPPG